MNGKESVVIVNKDGRLEQFGERYALGKMVQIAVWRSPNQVRWITEPDMRVVLWERVSEVDMGASLVDEEGDFLSCSSTTSSRKSARLRKVKLTLERHGQTPTTGPDETRTRKKTRTSKSLRARRILSCGITTVQSIY